MKNFFLLTIAMLLLLLATAAAHYIGPLPKPIRKTGNPALDLLVQAFPKDLNTPINRESLPYAAIEKTLFLDALGITLFKIETCPPNCDCDDFQTKTYFIDHQLKKAYCLRSDLMWNYRHKELKPHGYLAYGEDFDKDLADFNQWLSDKQVQKLDVESLNLLMAFHYQYDKYEIRFSDTKQLRSYVENALKDLEASPEKGRLTNKALLQHQLDSVLTDYKKGVYPLAYAEKNSLSMTFFKVDTLNKACLKVKKVLLSTYPD